MFASFLTYISNYDQNKPASLHMQNWVFNRSEVEKFKTFDPSTLNRGVTIPYLFQNIVKFLSQIMYYWYSSLLLQRIYKAWQFQFQLLRVCRMLCYEICKSYRPSRFIDHKLIIHSIHLSQKINLASIKTYKCKKL